MSRSRSLAEIASPKLIHAAGIVRDAAEDLAEENDDLDHSARCYLTANRMETTLQRAPISRERLIKASPSLVERTGRVKSLVEMIEADLGDETARVRLAKLLFRALLWIPESFPNR